jgi:hypothetical protein
MDENPYQSPALSDAKVPPRSLKCQRCGGVMEGGFVSANFGAGFVAIETVGKAFFSTEPLSSCDAWWAILPAAKWFKASLCRSCCLILVDYGEKLSHADAKQLARNYSPLTP